MANSIHGICLSQLVAGYFQDFHSFYSLDKTDFTGAKSLRRLLKSYSIDPSSEPFLLPSHFLPTTQLVSVALEEGEHPQIPLSK